MTNIKYRRDRSSVSKINIHLVFVTKYRKKRTRWARSPRPRELSVLFENKHLDCIKKVMNGVAKRMDFEILEIEGESDYIELRKLTTTTKLLICMTEHLLCCYVNKVNCTLMTL